MFMISFKKLLDSYIVGEVSMTQQRHSLDGFVPRRPSAQPVNEPNPKPVDGLHRQAHPITAGASSRRTLGAPLIAKSDLDESLRGIDNTDNDKKGQKRRGGKQKSKLRRIIKWVGITLLVAIVAIGGYF